MAENKIGVSIFLLKASQVAAFRLEIVEGHGLPLAKHLDGSFIALPNIPRSPDWISAISPLLQQPASIPLRNQSAGGLLVVTRHGQTFVISFGHAWLRLKDGWLERDFGRRVALNIVPKDQLVEISAEQVFAKWHFARERAPRASALKEFDIEYDRDLVSAIEGVPSDSTLGTIIRGATSLRVTIDLSNITSVLDLAGKLYQSNEYKKRWPEIDNLTPVVDKFLIKQLEDLLDKDLAKGLGAEKVILFAPSLRHEDISRADSYVFGRLKKAVATTPYLTYASWEIFLSQQGSAPSIQAAKCTPLHLLDDSKNEVAKRTVFDCFGYETSHNQLQYVLSSGVWYEAVSAFITNINSRINSLPLPSVLLPAWDRITYEREYNLHCYKSMRSSILHFDAKNIPYGGGQSKFEFCDLMHPAKRIMYFAKIPSRSSDLSHLAEQTRRTVDLFFSPDDGFRSRVRKAMTKFYPKANKAWLDARPRPGDWNLCLVSLGKEAKNYPLFAKCALARLVKDLEMRGHQVSFLAV